MIRKFIKGNFAGVLNHVIDYPTPSAISYRWGFGSLAGIFLGVQLVTGIISAMHYVPNIDYAFYSVEHIMRDVNYGWLIRYLHANGASMFSAIVYIHIGRGIYYGSYLYPREAVWITGIIIFILMMATALIGYVLPWGQMSFWGATVITNLFSAIPVVGESIVYWIWGGFSVGNATLNRFYSLHYLPPFVILVMVMLHIYISHVYGSNTPLGTDIAEDKNKIPFYPYFYFKDLLGLLAFLLLYLTIVLYYPNVLGHSDNYAEANGLVTPAHIVPEWYFPPFYAILRAIPNKLGGVICMGAAILVLLVLPITSDSMNAKSNRFKPLSRKIFWLFIGNFIILGWVGAQPVVAPYTSVGIFCTIHYFPNILIIIPLSDICVKYILRKM